MKLYLKHGITSLDSMKEHYNNFANGGKIPFKVWKAKMQAKYPDIEFDNQKAGYNYEAYFNANYEDAMKQLTNLQHFPDTYKLPNHPTFSNESIYSRGPIMGGSWVNDSTFTPSTVNRQYHPEIYSEDRNYTEREIYGNKFQDGGQKGQSKKTQRPLYNPPAVMPEWMQRMFGFTQVKKDLSLTEKLSRFRRSFETFSPKVESVKNTGKGSTNVLGYGLSFYINEDGSTRPLIAGETISREDAIEQLRRYDEVYGPAQIKNNLGLTNFDSYPDDLKFQLLEAMFNMKGPKSIRYRKDGTESNYYKALTEYEKNKGWEDSSYDYNQIYKHADWNKNTNGWIGVRAGARQYPSQMNWNDFYENIYSAPLNVMDSLRAVYIK